MPSRTNNILHAVRRLYDIENLSTSEIIDIITTVNDEGLLLRVMMHEVRDDEIGSHSLIHRILRYNESVFCRVVHLLREDGKIIALMSAPIGKGSLLQAIVEDDSLPAVYKTACLSKICKYASRDHQLPELMNITNDLGESVLACTTSSLPTLQRNIFEYARRSGVLATSTSILEMVRDMRDVTVDEYQTLLSRAESKQTLQYVLPSLMQILVDHGDVEKILCLLKQDSLDSHMSFLYELLDCNPDYVVLRQILELFSSRNLVPELMIILDEDYEWSDASPRFDVAHLFLSYLAMHDGEIDDIDTLEHHCTIILAEAKSENEEVSLALESAARGSCLTEVLQHVEIGEYNFAEYLYRTSPGAFLDLLKLATSYNQLSDVLMLVTSVGELPLIQYIIMKTDTNTLHEIVLCAIEEGRGDILNIQGAHGDTALHIIARVKNFEQTACSAMSVCDQSLANDRGETVESILSSYWHEKPISLVGDGALDTD
jgi:hypothetical protein